MRVGIDVGGTFTDAVAVDPQQRAVVARIKVPTTHDSPDGIAAGIRASLEGLLAAGVDPQSIVFIAHSTTQATNALLEGDLARVGVLGLLDRWSWPARSQMRLPALALGAGRFDAAHAFAKRDDLGAQRAAIQSLAEGGIEALAVSSAFGVDRPSIERRAASLARDFGIPAVSGSDASSLYGLRCRTRTAALNAALLPRMLRASRTTLQATLDAGIAAPLMVMRSDGGVMSVDEIERRPLATLLSGPAAGIAGALLHENVSDGIFIEVGGTSTDCSVIRAGRAQMRSGRIGTHNLLLRTLDVRTIGVAGGSLVAAERGRILHVGARSAHIAGYAYASYTSAERMHGAQIEAGPILALRARDGTLIAITPSCAANFLGDVPMGAFGRGEDASLRIAFALAAAVHAMEPNELASAILDAAIAGVLPTIHALIADYGLDTRRLELIGGGGAARAIVPHLARSIGTAFRIARDHEVISPIGVALALVRESVERQIVDPSAAQLSRIRRDVADRAIAGGAAPESVEIELAIDPIRSRVLATASGALGGAAALHETLDELQRSEIAARSLAVGVPDLRRIPLTDGLDGYAYGEAFRAIDRRGVIRLALQDPRVVRTSVAEVERVVRAAIEKATRFGDVGRLLPDLYILRAERISELRGFARIDRMLALLLEESGGYENEERMTLLIHQGTDRVG